MPWIAVLVMIGCVSILCLLCDRSADRDWGAAAVCCGILGGICAILAIILILNAICWTCCLINLDIAQEKVNTQGVVYKELLDNYTNILMIQDVTASENYLDLYNKILNYNYQVNKANKWKNTWGASGLLYDPSYEKAEVIPIN